MVGMLNDQVCIDMLTPLEIKCPADFRMVGPRCIKSETALHQMVCPPNTIQDGYHCVEVMAGSAGFSCERGELDGGLCIEHQEFPAEFLCPHGFSFRGHECAKVTYFSCHNHDLPVKLPHTSCEGVGCKRHLMRRLGDKPKQIAKPYFPPPAESIPAETCWDMQIVNAGFTCPYDAKLEGRVCIKSTIFPLAQKCGGFLEGGKCMVEVRTNARWSCPLGFSHGGDSGSSMEGLHGEVPSVVSGKHGIDPNYASQWYSRGGGRHPRVPDDRLYAFHSPSTVSLPLGSEDVVEYSPMQFSAPEMLSKKRSGLIGHILEEEKKLKSTVKDELLQEKPRKHLKHGPGYCYRETIAGHIVVCPHGYEAQPNVKSCLGKSNPVLLCDKGFELTPSGKCVMFEFVEALRLVPASVVHCSDADCPFVQVGEGWKLGARTKPENSKALARSSS